MEIESKIVYQILVPYIIGMITIVAPISVSVISSLNTQYNSSKILGLFMRHRATCWLAACIILNIIALFTYIIGTPRCVDWEFWNPFIDHSAFWLIITSCSFSLIILGWFIWTMVIFLNPLKLRTYITEKGEKVRKEKGEKVLSSLSDLYKRAIDTDAREIMQDITNTIRNLLIKERNTILEQENIKELEQKNVKELEQKKQDITNKLKTTGKQQPIEELRQKELKLIEELKQKKLKLIEELKQKEIRFSKYLTDCVILSFEKNIAEKPNNLLDSMNANFFSCFIVEDMTLSDYSVLWELITTTIKKNKLRVFSNYWTRANSNLSFKSKMTDHVIIQKGEEHQARNKFIVFNLLVCSYLLYQKKYTYLTYAFSYSSYSPPHYFLIPSCSAEVMSLYCYFCKDDRTKFYDFTYICKFEELFNPAESFSNIGWVKKLCALLFIRLFNILPYLLGDNALSIPKSPDTSRECKLLLDNIEYLEQEIKEIIEEKELLFALQLWERKKATPENIEDIQQKTTTFFEKYNSQLKKDLEWRRINEAIKNFNKNTLPNIITKLKDEKELFFNHNLVYKKEYFSIYGLKDISERHIIDHYLKDEILSRIEQSFSNIAKKCQFKEVLFNNEQEIEEAIKILNHEKHNLLVLISGFTKPENTIERTIFDTMTDKSINIEGDENNIKWMNNFEGRRPYDYSVYILSKEELPHFSLEPFTEEEFKKYVEKYGLELYNDEDIENVYFRIEDLSDSDNPEVEKLNQILKKETNQNLNESIFTAIEFIGKYTYNPSTPILCFRVGKNDENNIGKIKEIKNEFLNRVKEEKIKEEPPNQIEGS